MSTLETLPGLNSNAYNMKSQTLLQFYKVHGENIQLSADQRIARRSALSFCGGITFSARSIRPNEKVYLRVVELPSSEPPIKMLGIGFSSVNPVLLTRSQFKHSWAELTSKPGFWGKRYVLKKPVDVCVELEIFYTASGYVMLTVDDIETDVFLSGLDASSLLWLMVDIYGNTTVQFIDPEKSLNETSLLASMNRLNLNQAKPIPKTAMAEDIPQPPPLRHYRDQDFQPLTFYPGIHGTNLKIGSDCCTAIRFKSYCNGYVMSSRPIMPGESCVVQVVQAVADYCGGLGFSLTTCNPASLKPTDMPDDAYQFFDRREYWVISKDVVREPLVGDEIEFHLSHGGIVTMRRNGGDAKQLTDVDVSHPLWAAFDVYGNATGIRLLGTIVQPQQTKKPQALVEAPTTPSNGSSNECVVCYEKSIDSALSSCGHMCLCYDCALVLKNSTHRVCPICRSPIREVIRIYRS